MRGHVTLRKNINTTPETECQGSCTGSACSSLLVSDDVMPLFSLYLTLLVFAGYDFVESNLERTSHDSLRLLATSRDSS